MKLLAENKGITILCGHWEGVEFLPIATLL